MERVYVITDNDAGWDCVVGVYERLEDAVALCNERVENKQEYDPQKSVYNYDFGMLIIHDKPLR